MNVSQSTIFTLPIFDFFVKVKVWFTNFISHKYHLSGTAATDRVVSYLVGYRVATYKMEANPGIQLRPQPKLTDFGLLPYSHT